MWPKIFSIWLLCLESPANLEFQNAFSHMHTTFLLSACSVHLRSSLWVIEVFVVHIYLLLRTLILSCKSSLFFLSKKICRYFRCPAFQNKISYEALLRTWRNWYCIYALNSRDRSKVENNEFSFFIFNRWTQNLALCHNISRHKEKIFFSGFPSKYVTWSWSLHFFQVQTKPYVHYEIRDSVISIEIQDNEISLRAIQYSRVFLEIIFVCSRDFFALFFCETEFRWMESHC